jgi:branched-subunit amino acid transport protein
VSLGLIVIIAVMTYGSRALALVFMPDPPARVRAVLDRLPAPLFASLAAISLVKDGGPAAPETLCAGVGALVLAPTRSLLWVLLGGLVGFALAAGAL